MLLGKRPRPPMKRTTSMTEFTLDLNAPPADASIPAVHGLDGLDQRFISSLVSPRPNRRSSADLSQSTFLRSCGLCKRRLVPGRDLYMYRGDSAFCSLECRQQQMNQDERKEKCSVASTATGAAAKSAKTGTVAAV